MLRIKWENIFTILFIPVCIIQYVRSADSLVYDIASIITSLLILSLMYLIIRTIRIDLKK